MVNESCLGFDPKFLELKEEVHVRKREEGDMERKERYMYMREYSTFIVLCMFIFPLLSLSPLSLSLL